LANRIQLVTCLLFALSVSPASGERDPDAVKPVLAHRDAFATEIQAFIGQLEQKDQLQAAKLSRRWTVPAATDRQILFFNGGQFSQDETAVSPANTDWRLELTHLRDQQTNRLWSTVGDAHEQQEAARAVQRLYEILWLQPDDKRARRSLGLKPETSTKAGVTSTPRLARNAKHAYGWPAGKYWRMQTKHFLITTDHSAEAAQRLAVILEEFHIVWRQMFISYTMTPAAACLALKGRGLPNRSAVRHRVVLFRSKQEYVAYLRQYETQIEMTLGIYRDKDRTAYFFAGEDNLESTWRHEVAHQLFFETTRRSRSVGQDHNFWLIEGIALYLESLQRHDGYYFVGGIDAERLQYARYRALNDGFYMPLAAFCRLGRSAMQSDPQLRRLYSQAAGLTHFLMDAQGGKFRQPTISLLRDIYAGTDKEGSLAEKLEVEFDVLDRAYRDYLRIDDDQLTTLPINAKPKMLSLGNTRVTDLGMSRLAAEKQPLSRLERLEWLDLAHCEITDVGIERLHENTPLRRLNLEGTRITDKSMKRIGQFHDLEELDLSNTQVSDAGLRELLGLTKLRVFWLTGTHVSDQGLQWLAQLPQLRTLDVGRSQITTKAWKVFENEHPQLNQQNGQH